MFCLNNKNMTKEPLLFAQQVAAFLLTMFFGTIQLVGESYETGHSQ